MAGYIIGSSNGKQIADSMKAGSTYKASDGSTWKKNSDGSVSVTTKQGGYTANALSGGSSSSSVSSSSKSSSSYTPSPISTNTSYNGNFLTIDTGRDYKSIKDSAKAKGDYATAAKAEAERNAKLIYLGRGNEVTNEFVQTYGKAPTNNQSGMTFENKFKTVSDLPSNWSSAMLNGATYKKDSSGKIYQESGATSAGKTYTLVGDGFNKDTGDFTFSNPEDARNEAYRQYVGSGGNNAVAKEYALNNLIDGEYIDALLKGETTAYTKNVLEIAKQKQEEVKRAALSTKYADVDNSFESDFDKDVTIDIPIVDEEKKEDVKETIDPYQEFINRLVNKNRRNIY